MQVAQQEELEKINGNKNSRRDEGEAMAKKKTMRMRDQKRMKMVMNTMTKTTGTVIVTKRRRKKKKVQIFPNLLKISHLLKKIPMRRSLMMRTEKSGGSCLVHIRFSNFGIQAWMMLSCPRVLLCLQDIEPNVLFLSPKIIICVFRTFTGRGG